MDNTIKMEAAAQRFMAKHMTHDADAEGTTALTNVTYFLKFGTLPEVKMNRLRKLWNAAVTRVTGK